MRRLHRPRWRRYSKMEMALMFIGGATFAKFLTDPGAAEAIGKFLSGFLEMKEKSE